MGFPWVGSNGFHVHLGLDRFGITDLMHWASLVIFFGSKRVTTHG